MLEIASLTKTFHPGTPNEVRALRDVSLRLDRGSFLLIIGTNGSGKSTMLNAVAGTFLPHAGSLTLAGQTITRRPEHRGVKLFGWVHNKPYMGMAPTLASAVYYARAART